MRLRGWSLFHSTGSLAGTVVVNACDLVATANGPSASYALRADSIGTLLYDPSNRAIGNGLFSITQNVASLGTRITVANSSVIASFSFTSSYTDNATPIEGTFVFIEGTTTVTSVMISLGGSQRGTTIVVGGSAPPARWPADPTGEPPLSVEEILMPLGARGAGAPYLVELKTSVSCAACHIAVQHIAAPAGTLETSKVLLIGRYTEGSRLLFQRLNANEDRGPAGLSADASFQLDGNSSLIVRGVVVTAQMYLGGALRDGAAVYVWGSGSSAALLCKRRNPLRI